jgi:Tfp pilus assembly protein PilF
MTKINRVLNYIFPLFSGLTILFFIPTWSGLDVGKTYFFVIGTCILALIFIFSAFYKKEISLPDKKILWITGGLMCFIIVSVFFAPVTWLAVFGRVLEFSTVVFMSMLLIFMTLAIYFFSAIKNTTKYIAIVSVFFVITALFQICLLLFPNVFGLGTFVQKTQTLIGTWHDLGIFATLFLFGALYVLVSKKMTLVQNIILYSFVSVSLFFVFLNNLRHLYAITFVLVAYCAFIAFKKRKKNTTKYLILASIGLMLVFGFIFQQRIGLYLTKRAIVYSEVKPSLGSTLTVFGKTVKNSPLFGAGPNHFSVSWNQYKPAVVNNSVLFQTQFNVGNSTFFSLAVAYGPVFALMSILLLGMYVFYSIKKIRIVSGRDATDTTNHTLFYTKFIFVISLYYVFIFFTQNLSISHWILFISSISIVLGHLHYYGLLHLTRVTYSSLQSKFKKIGWFSTLIISVVVVGYVLTISVIKVYAYGVAEMGSKSLNKGDTETAITRFSKAYSIDQNDIYARLVSQIAFKKINEVNEQQITDENKETLKVYFQNLFSQTVEAGQVAYNRNPKDLDNVINLITIYRSVIPAVKDAYSQTVNMIDYGMKLSPESPVLHLYRARAEFDNGDTVEAQNYAERAIQAKGNYSEAYVFLSRLFETTNDTAKSKEYLEYAILADPQNLTALSDYAIISLNEKDYEVVAGVLSQMLSVDPMLHQVRFYFALALVELGQVDQAIAQFEILRTYFPDNTDLTSQINMLKNNQSAPIEEENSTENQDQ